MCNILHIKETVDKGCVLQRTGASPRLATAANLSVGLHHNPL